MSKLLTTAELCRTYKLGTCQSFLQKLVRKGYFHRTKDGRYMPTPAYAGYNLVRYHYKRGWRMRWTQQGVNFIYDLKHGQARIHLKTAAHA